MDIKLYNSKSLINNEKIKIKSKSIKNIQKTKFIKKELTYKHNLNKGNNLDEFLDNIYLDELELHN